MQRRISRRDRAATASLLALAGFAAIPNVGSAQVRSWTYTTGTSWSEAWFTSSNWDVNNVPNTPTETAAFGPSQVSGGAGSINLTSQTDVGTIIFNSSGSNGYTVGGAGTINLAVNATDGGFINVSANNIGTISTGMTAPANSFWTKTGLGVVVLNGASNYPSVGIQINDGIVRVTNGSALNGISVIATSGTGELELLNTGTSLGNIILGDGSNPALNSASGNNVWNGNWFVLTANAGVGVASGSTLTLNGNITDGTVPPNGFSKVGAGMLKLTNLRLNGPLTLSGGTLNIIANGGNAATSILPSLTISGAGALDLTNDKLIVKNGDTSVLHGYLGTGYANGAWNGPGIDSSTAAADASAHSGKTDMSLGYAKGNQLTTWNGTSASFGGQTLGANDVAIGYIERGDTNLDGLVDIATDFANIVNGLNGSTGITSGGANWIVGDFNYDGSVDIPNDFSAFVSGFKALGGSTSSLNSAIDSSGLSASQEQQMHNIANTVPEPAAVSSILAAVVPGLCCARRRRR